MGGPERPQQRQAERQLNPDKNQALMKSLNMTDIRLTKRKEDRLEYDASIEGQAYQLILIEREDEVEVRAIRSSDSKKFIEMAEKTEGAKPLLSALRGVCSQIHATRVEEEAKKQLKKAEESALLANQDPNQAMMRQLGIEDIRLLGAEKSANLDTKKYEIKIKIYEGGGKFRFQTYRLYIYDSKDHVNVIAYGHPDASVEYGETIQKRESNTALYDALYSVYQQLHQNQVKAEGVVQSKKAKEKAEAEKSASTEEQVLNFFQEQLPRQVGLMLLSAMMPMSTNPSLSASSTEATSNYRLPSQEARAQRAEKVAEAQKEVKETVQRLSSTRRLQVSAELQQNWSWKYLNQPAGRPAQDEVTKSLEKRGLKNVSIKYPDNGLRIYQYTEGDRLIKFTILPGGTIRYQTESPVATVAQPSMGYIIHIVDSKQGDLKAASLDDAIAKVTEVAKMPLDESRQFLYFPIPGIQPWDVTGNPVMQAYALPYPVMTNIPTRDYKIPMPVLATQSRDFLYRPIKPGARAPFETSRTWYQLGKQAEENIAGPK